MDDLGGGNLIYLAIAAIVSSLPWAHFLPSLHPSHTQTNNLNPRA
jgi:hypothetical protein